MYPTRSAFIRSGALTAGAIAATTGQLGAQLNSADAADLTSKPKRLLVLSGGIAWGAYEAGVLYGLARAKDGPITYDAVCATSAGTLNGAMFVTNQIEGLYNLWSTIGSRTVLQPKPQYAKVINKSSGVLDRAIEIVSMIHGLVGGDLRGICASDPVTAILNEVLLENGKVKEFAVPFYWTATDLTRGCGGMFYRGPSALTRAEPNYRKTSFTPELAGAKPTEGLSVTDVIESIRASTAFPGVFEPATINGQLLVDGGVVNNTPVSLVREAVKDGPVIVDVVILNAQDFTGQSNDQSKNLVSIAVGLFSMIGQRLVDDGMRQLAADNATSQLLRKVLASPNGTAMTNQVGTLLRDYSIASSGASQLLQNDVTINALRPAKILAGNAFDFGDQKSITANLQLGFTDITTRGFQAYEVPSAICTLSD